MLDRTGRTRIVEHSSEHGSWQMALLVPEPWLAPFVRRFNAYSEQGTGFARRREAPSGLATLVFNLGAELRVEYPADTCRAFSGGTGFFAGLHSKHAVTETDGAQDGVQVMLTPLGARQLLALPLDEVDGSLMDPLALFGAEARETIGRLQDSFSRTERLAILEQMVERRIAASRPVPRDLAWAWRRLQDDAGRISVSALAAEIGCSRKHLTVRFRREFGMSPKLLARVLRFSRVMQQLARGHTESWAELAARCGYADQAHLTREFREFAGSPPAAFSSRRLPDEGGFVD